MRGKLVWTVGMNSQLPLNKDSRNLVNSLIDTFCIAWVLSCAAWREWPLLPSRGVYYVILKRLCDKVRSRTWPLHIHSFHYTHLPACKLLCTRLQLPIRHSED